MLHQASVVPSVCRRRRTNSHPVRRADAGRREDPWDLLEPAELSGAVRRVRGPTARSKRGLTRIRLARQHISVACRPNSHSTGLIAEISHLRTIEVALECTTADTSHSQLRRDASQRSINQRTLERALELLDAG